MSRFAPRWSHKDSKFESFERLDSLSEALLAAEARGSINYEEDSVQSSGPYEEDSVKSSGPYKAQYAWLADVDQLSTTTAQDTTAQDDAPEVVTVWFDTPLAGMITVL